MTKTWGQYVGQTDKKPKPALAVFHIIRAAFFITIEVMAAIQLGGFLGVALWLMALWSAGWTLLAVWGLAMLAAKGLDKPEDAV